jgi:hypothetical protein
MILHIEEMHSPLKPSFHLSLTPLIPHQHLLAYQMMVEKWGQEGEHA